MTLILQYKSLKIALKKILREYNMSKPIKDTLLTEAIAEANQVRAAAIANAKAALEEAFAPQLSSMYTKKLRTEMEDNAIDGHGADEGGDTDASAIMTHEQTKLTSSGIDSVDNKQPASGARSSSKIDNPGQEVDKMGENTVPSDGHEKAGEDVTKRTSSHKKLTQEQGNHFAKAVRSPFDAMHEEEPEFGDDEDEDEFGGNGDDEFSPDMDNDGEDDFELDFGDDEEEDMDDMDLDLEALIRELEADIRGFGDEEEEDEFPMDMEEDVSKAARELPATVSVPEEPHSAPEGAPQYVKLSESDDEDEDDDEVDLDEILREMDVDGFGGESETLRSENVALKHSLQEHRTVVRFLKGRLEEMNVLNGKLLYTNKLFKNYNLNPGQKMKIVENFDRASTLREVRLVYVTLAESFSGSTKKSSNAKIVTEGMASRAIGSTKPRGPQQVLEEGAEMRARFQKIAGIIKS